MSLPAMAQTLQDEVKYSARDSMRYDLAQQTVYLYGAATVKYQDMQLSADRIRLDLAREEVQAFGTRDSSGNTVGAPKFSQGGQDVSADSIRYNFKTKEGLIKDVRTTESSMYAMARLSKRHPNGEVHSLGGSLTTCDRPHPHYRFQVAKMMVIPDDKIIVGPAIMKLGNVPTPLVAPFGFFPNHKGGAAGLLIPSWGSSDQFGIYLLNGGWYFPIGDKFDQQLTADIYSKGSWGLHSITRYKQRYRYSGNLDLQYTDKVGSNREYPDFSEQRTFFIRWNHLMDPKASLSDRFTASVNLGSSQNFTNNFNSSTSDYLTNTFQSNINWSRLWPGKPYSISVAARHSQNTLNQTFDITLPSVNFIVQRIFPGTWFRPEAAAAKQKWYERIGLSWNSAFDNRLGTTQDQLAISNLPALVDRMRNGVRHTGTVSTSIKTRAFTLNPQLNITDRTYFDALRKAYNPASATVATDTVPGLRNVFDWNIGATATSKFYGMYAFRGGRLTAIRHVVTPSAAFTFLPGNDTRIFGPYGPGGAYGSYSPYDIGIYGQPSPNASGLVTLGLVQSVEGKMRSRKTDAPGEPQLKKITFLDYFGINANYDLLKDSLRWSPVSAAARTKLLNVLDLNLNSSWDPYATDSIGRNINRGTRTVDGTLAHLRSTTAAIGFELQSKRYGKPAGSQGGNDQVVADVDPSKGGRINFSIPWHLRVNYSWSMARNYRAAEFTEQQTQSVLFNGDLNILKYWKLGFSSGYDMQAGEWTPTALNLYWDLHCWEFNVNVVPMGIRKSFTFRINVKASVLHDLKYELRKPFGNQNGLLY